MARSMRICVVALALFAAVAFAVEDIVELDVDVDADIARADPACNSANVREAILLTLQNQPTLSLFRSVINGQPTQNPPVPGANLGNNGSPRTTKLTVFAPTNDVFTAARIDQAAINRLSQPDRDALIRRHIVNGARPLKSLKNGNTLTTLGGDTLTVSVAGTGATRTVTIRGPNNSVTITAPTNVKSCKTFIHGINGVLLNSNGRIGA